MNSDEQRRPETTPSSIEPGALVLVTGATGYIGGRLVTVLLEAVSVTAPTRLLVSTRSTTSCTASVRQNIGKHARLRLQRTFVISLQQAVCVESCTSVA